MTLQSISKNIYKNKHTHFNFISLKTLLNTSEVVVHSVSLCVHSHSVT